MKIKTSLFSRTAVTVAAGLVVFQLVSGIAIALNIIIPLAQRSADDLAIMLVWSARTWHGSSVQQRLEFEQELQTIHGLRVSVVNQPLEESSKTYPYLYFLRIALNKHLPDKQQLRLSADAREHFQVEFQQQGQLIHFDFSNAILGPRPVVALAWTLSAGILATLIITWFLARRITAPVGRLVQAARHIGQGEQPQKLPETGGRELAELAQVFNHTSQQLHARRENQKTLLSGISHDLRSPLARMKMALGLLAEQQSSALVNRMEYDIAEIDTLIGAQLELARAEEQEATEITDIEQLLNDLIDAAEAREPGRLYLRTASRCAISVAPVSLRRCLDNLINNALRYSDQKKVEVICRRFSSAVCISVRDRGPGIAEDQFENVFRPFFRIESSRNRSTGGSGLGLAITRQLAETHGWKVAFKARRGGGLSAWLIIGVPPKAE